MEEEPGHGLLPATHHHLKGCRAAVPPIHIRFHARLARENRLVLPRDITRQGAESTKKSSSETCRAAHAAQRSKRREEPRPSGSGGVNRSLTVAALHPLRCVRGS